MRLEPQWTSKRSLDTPLLSLGQSTEERGLKDDAWDEHEHSLEWMQRVILKNK